MEDLTYETEWESNKDDALRECIDQAGNITIEMEHFIDENDNTVEQQNLVETYTAVQKIANLRYFEHSVTIEGKYRVYEEVLEYDFSEQLMEFLQDSLGYNYEELFEVYV